MEMHKKVKQTGISFNENGVDPYGLSINHLVITGSLMKLIYRYYFRIKCYGIENIPDEKPALLVGNHSGGIPIDGGMVALSLVLEKEKPRIVHSMVDKFAFRMPLISSFFARVGQFSGQPDLARRLLKEGRILLVFPEGSKGIGKAIPNRYRLVHFTNGFMRIALQTGAPVIPFAFIGGEESTPVITRSRMLGKLVGSPFVPITPYMLPLPLPVSCQIYYGKPMYFKGTGNESDDLVEKCVKQVKRQVEELIAIGRKNRNTGKKTFGGLRNRQNIGEEI